MSVASAVSFGSAHHFASICDFADASPQPDPAELYENVYSEINEHGLLFLDGRDDDRGARKEG